MIFSILLAVIANAFTLLTNEGAAFQADEVKVDYDLPSCQSAFSEGHIQSMINEANKLWNKIPYSSLNLVLGENRASTRENGILMTCDEAWTNESAGGIGTPEDVTGDRIISGSFTLNTNPALSNNVQDRNFEKQVKLTAHEIGHCFGLGHSDKEWQLMSAKRNPEGGIGEDDISGVVYLYPENEEIFGCGSLSTGGFGGGGGLGLLAFLLMCLGAWWAARVGGHGRRAAAHELRSSCS